MFHIHSFFPLLNHFISFLFFGFAAGASALAEPATEPAVVAEPGAEPVTEGVAPAEGTTQEPAEPVTEPAKEATPTAPQDGRQIPAAVRSHLAELKKTNPQLAKELNDYVWGYKQLKAELGPMGVKEIQEIKTAFPEGIQEAVALKTAFDQLAGADSVEEFSQEVNEYRQLDQAFINGDPKFIETALSKCPDGLKKLMPAMQDAWAKLDPDSFDRHMTWVIVGSLANNGFTANMARAVDYLEMQDANKENPVIQKVVKILSDNLTAIDNWNKFARAAPPAPAKDPNAEKNAQEAERLEKEKTTFFVQGLARDLNSHTTQKIDEQLKELKRTIPGERKIFQQRVIKAVTTLLDSDPTFKTKYAALITAKDHDGALKLLKSRSEQHWPKVVDQEYKLIYGTAKMGAQDKKTVTAKSNGAPVTPPKPAAGWVKVDASLDPSLIDRRQTQERDIVFSKKAILKDGRKVYWGDKIPT